MQYEVETLGKFKVIHIIGNISPDVGSKMIDETISELIEKGFHHFVFNLEKVTYLDSSGIGIFIHCLCDVKENDGSLQIIAEENQVFEVLSLVGVDRLITIHTSVDEFKKVNRVI